MNRDAIKNTAVCSYDRKEKLYTIESPLLNICSGIAETEDEAREIFEDGLDAMYIEYLEGRQVGQYAKRGRPAKNRVNLNCQVKPETIKSIKKLAAKLGVSQGECVDFLYAHWSALQTFAVASSSKRRNAARNAKTSATAKSSSPVTKPRKTKSS
jgi:lipoate synthase